MNFDTLTRGSYDPEFHSLIVFVFGSGLTVELLLRSKPGACRILGFPLGRFCVLDLGPSSGVCSDQVASSFLQWKQRKQTLFVSYLFALLYYVVQYLVGVRHRATN